MSEMKTIDSVATIDSALINSEDKITSKYKEVYCPNCGEIYPSDVYKCSNCGAHTIALEN